MSMSYVLTKFFELCIIKDFVFPSLLLNQEFIIGRILMLSTQPPPPSHSERPPQSCTRERGEGQQEIHPADLKKEPEIFIFSSITWPHFRIKQNNYELISLEVCLWTPWSKKWYCPFNQINSHTQMPTFSGFSC